MATALNNLGALQFCEGLIDEAFSSLSKSLHLFENSNGGDHPYTARVLNNLGLVLFAQHRNKEAKEVWDRGLSIYLETLGLRPCDTAQVQTLLGLYHLHHRELEKAFGLLSQSLQTRRLALGYRHPQLGMSHVHMMRISRELNDN